MHVSVPFDIKDTPELHSALTGLGWYQRLGGIAKAANTRLDVQQSSCDSKPLLKSNRQWSHASGGWHL